MEKKSFCHRRILRSLLGLCGNLIVAAVFCCAIVGTSIVLIRTDPRSVSDFFMVSPLILTILYSIFQMLNFSGRSFVILRGFLIPEKSFLARQIRGQLSGADGGRSAAELYAMVDRDLEEHGKKFDRVWAGREWILGGETAFIPRIRIVFSINQFLFYDSGVAVVCMDDRRGETRFKLRRRETLPLLEEHLKAVAPDALYLPYSQHQTYAYMPEDEWTQVLWGYDKRKARREAGQPVSQD